MPTARSVAVPTERIIEVVRNGPASRPFLSPAAIFGPPPHSLGARSPSSDSGCLPTPLSFSGGRTARRSLLGRGSAPPQLRGSPPEREGGRPDRCPPPTAANASLRCPLPRSVSFPPISMASRRWTESSAFGTAAPICLADGLVVLNTRLRVPRPAPSGENEVLYRTVWRWDPSLFPRSAAEKVISCGVSRCVDISGGRNRSDQIRRLEDGPPRSAAVDPPIDRGRRVCALPLRGTMRL